MLSASDIKRVREETPGCKDYIHFNNAGASLMPVSVITAIKNHLDLESGIGGYEAAEEEQSRIKDFYNRAAILLNCESQNIAYTSNATDAYARALLSIPFKPEDVILTSSNDYVSNHLAMLALEKRLGIKIEILPNTPNGEVDVSALEERLRLNPPKLISLTHVPTNSGLIQPAEQVGQLARAHNVLYLLDACQSIGQLELDINRLQCDYLSATFRKFLRGPRGAGMLFVSDRILSSDLHPLMVDMRGATWTSERTYELQQNASRFEDWENSYALLLGASEAIDYTNQLSLAAIEERVSSLSSMLRSRLKEIRGIRLLDKGKRLAGLVTLTIDDCDPGELKQFLSQERVNSGISHRHVALVDFKEKGANWALRLSPHYYNTEDEVNVVSNILKNFQSSRT